MLQDLYLEKTETGQIPGLCWHEIRCSLGCIVLCCGGGGGGNEGCLRELLDHSLAVLSGFWRDVFAVS